MTIDQILQICISIIGFMIVFGINKISKDLHDIASSVDQLNYKMATIVERVDTHEKRINKIEEKL
jgi:uncharacterized protein YoxC